MPYLSRPDGDHPRSVHGEGMTLSAQVARHARTIPHAVALTQGETRRSYRELDARVSRFANALCQQFTSREHRSRRACAPG